MFNSSSTPRVALALPSLASGGAELITLRLARGMAEQDVAVDLVLGQAQGGLIERVPPGVRVVDLGEQPPALVWKTAGLARYMRRERPAAVISALDVAGAALWARALSGTRTPVVMWVRTHLTQQIGSTSVPTVAAMRRAALRAAYPRADAVVAVSHGVARDLAQLTGMPADRLHVIHNPVVTPALAERAAEPLDHPWFGPDQPPVILGAGRVVYQKGFDLLVDAFAQVRAKRPARLVIVGATDPREPDVPAALERRAADLGVAADVALLGYAPNPYAYMARSAAFALSSRYEGFGNVLAEALALGLPVVSTDCPSGPSEILDGGRYGRMVPVGDADAFASALLDTLAAPADTDRLRARGAHFSVARATAAHLDVLRGLDVLPAPHAAPRRSPAASPKLPA